MKDRGNKSRRQREKETQDARRERLKLALRENLKRRRSQARGRDDFTVSSPTSDDVTAREPGEKHPGK
jgi:hypothetical protein